MDDSLFTPFRSLVFCLFLLGGFIAQAANFEHISLQQKAQLERQFEEAKSASSPDGPLLNRRWTCDMFGVRSRMQVQRNINLYSLRRALSGYRNEGSQVVSQYEVKDGALSGANGRFEDHLRMMNDGQLISRLSLRGRTEPEAVIAYAVCR